MANTAVPADTLADSGKDLAASGGLPFGKVLARAAKIPLRRWKLSLVVCAVSAVVAVLAAWTLGRTSYPVDGKLRYRPVTLPDNLKTVYTPLNKLTVRDLIKRSEHLEQAGKELGLSLPPSTLNLLVTIDEKTPEESEVIGVSLDWEDPDQGAKLLKRLMELLRDFVKEDRQEKVQKAIDGNQEARKGAEESLAKTQKEFVAFLREKKIFDPKANLSEKREEYKRLEKEYENSLARQKTNEEQRKRYEEEIERLRKLQKESPESADEESEKIKRGLVSLLAVERENLKKAERELESKRNKVKDLKELVDKRIRLPADMEALQLDIKALEGSVKSGKVRVDTLEKDLDQNKPFSKAIERHQASIENLKNELIGIKTDIAQKEKRLKPVADAVREAEKIEDEADPYVKAIQEAQNDLLNQAKRGQDLNTLLTDLKDRFEIEIDKKSAVTAGFPKSNRRRIVGLGFLIPALCLFGIMIAFEMSSKSWRVESVAAGLDLPILARYSPYGTNAGQRGPNATECRGLSLRLRQFVPDSGAVILFSSLNERHGVEKLIGDLVGYFALRDEKVLILDARIASSEANEIQRCVGRALSGLPVEVTPQTDSQSTAPSPRRGLVQYLVFEGQDPWNLAVPTRTPSVDYLPAGGPYPHTDALASEAMRDLLEACRQKYSLILLVGPAASKSIDTEILAAYVNGLVLVLNEPLSAFTPETRAFFQTLKEGEVPLLGAVQCV
jgi:hypothetical protein